MVSRVHQFTVGLCPQQGGSRFSWNLTASPRMSHIKAKPHGHSSRIRAHLCAQCLGLGCTNSSQTEFIKIMHLKLMLLRTCQCTLNLCQGRDFEFHLTYEETEAQRGDGICTKPSSRSHLHLCTVANPLLL